MVLDGWEVKDMTDQYGKVAIVTGGSSGVGFETAKHLALQNVIVVIASRNEENGRRAARAINDIEDVRRSTGKAIYLPLDLGNFDSIHHFVKQFLHLERKVDGLLRMLINNAGVLKPPHEVTPDGFEVTLKTNYFGHFLLTHLLLPRLVQNSPSRVVTTTSDISNIGRIRWGDLKGSTCRKSGLSVYARSKLMLHMFGVELQRRAVDAGVESFLVHPGFSKSVMTMVNLGPLAKMGQDPERGALSTLYCATSDHVIGHGGHLYGPKFAIFSNTSKIKRWRHQMTDSNDCLKLWRETEDILGITRSNRAMSL